MLPVQSLQGLRNLLEVRDGAGENGGELNESEEVVYNKCLEKNDYGL